MKRVLIFSLAYFPQYVGGAEVALKEITDRISPEEIEFHMVTNRFDSALPRVEKIGNITIHRIGITTTHPTAAQLKRLPLSLNKPLFQFLAAYTAWRLNRRYRYDAIWAMMAHSSGVPAAIFKFFHPQTPYILTLQEGDPPEYIERKMRPVSFLFTRAFTKADRVQAISNFLGTWARRKGFTGPLEIIPNGVNTKHFSQTYTQSDLEALKKELNIRDGHVILLTTSRLVTKNAVDDVIRALPLLPDTVHFVVLGTGPDEVMLKTLARDLGVSRRILWVGHVPQEEIPKYLNVSDIFIRPSRSEGFGNSFVEAMAAKVPVIATQAGGIADFLFDAKYNPTKQTTGWAVEVNSPREIAKAVQDIMSHPDQVKQVVQDAYTMVSSTYDWDIVAQAMHERIFATVL